ncbi:MAG: 5'-methylthioadenosine/adenosylhomocysteine nucleosidase [Phycisphaerales bacterium]|nr:5'-methylthioadenosine/adenosylhomocysteine nucleosidase [Phycisphaerales bacterium]
MGAMPEEVEGLRRDPLYVHGRSERVGDREFHTGVFGGVGVVLVFSRWGKVAAGITASQLIERFGVREIWFTGVAGRLDPALRVGDIVVGRRLIQHDMDARPLFARYEVPLSGRTFMETSELVRKRLLDAAIRFVGEIDLHIAADVRGRFGLRAPAIVVGDIATGDRFIRSRAESARLRAELPTCACVEMEGAAVAQACLERGVPFGVVRTISDSADDSAHVDFPRFLAEVASVYSERVVGGALAGGKWGT